MEILYQLGEAPATEVAKRMPDDAGYDSVRVILGVLEKKGHVKVTKDGRRNIYYPTVSRERAIRSAVRSLTKTFFRGSPSKAVLSILDTSSDGMSEQELAEIAEWIEQERTSK